MDLLIAFTTAITVLAPFPGDTPPTPPPIAQLETMSSLASVVANTRLADGAPAPAGLLPPGMLNQGEMVAFLRDNYPDTRRESGAPRGGFLWLFIDRDGRVGEMCTIKSTGSAAFDSLAVRAVRMLRFTPASLRGEAVAVWVPFPVHIGPLGKLRAFAEPEGSLQEKPVFTPYTVKPTLLNRDEVARALVLNYPTKLREKGIGGTTMIWVLLDAHGLVRKAQVKETSGYPTFDEAAVQVARTMRFTPARNRDAPVAVWIALPVVFKAN